MKGVYAIFLRIKSNKRIRVGRLGIMRFKKGFYCYIGSATGNLSIESRCRRHIRKKKKLKWHIDYLRKEGDIMSIIACESEKSAECEISRKISLVADLIVPKFGNSDCDCPSHLFYFKHEKSLKKVFSIFSKGIQIYPRT